MITLIVSLLILGLICWLAFYAMNAMGAPQPVRVVVIVLLCIVLIIWLSGFLPAGGLGSLGWHNSFR